MKIIGILLILVLILIILVNLVAIIIIVRKETKREGFGICTKIPKLGKHINKSNRS